MSLKKGELVDFEAHLVGRSRNAAKPRVKRGRKSTLTADRMEKLLGCVRRGLSNKHACMVAGISETTFYRWIEKGKHAKRGPYRDFWNSLQAAHAHFEKFHLQAIARSSLEETQSTREVIEYEGAEVVTLPDGKRQLRPGKVKSVRLEIHTHPPTPKGSMWLLAHRFPALLHGPEQIADLPVPVAESPGAVRIGHPERSHLVEYLAPNSVFNSLPRQRSSPHLRPDDRLVTIDRVLHHASLGVA